MSLSLYEGRRRRDPAPLMALQAANLVFAASSVFLWALMSLFMAEPIRWATARGVGMRPELLEYPFILLWLLPVAGACAAWVAQKAQRLKLAYFLAFYPILWFGLVVGWYYLMPVQWH
ncbi:MAG: hypothetical protein KJZ80_15510 [Hyphomicrobiaceae bacterium]|nr:hypothetical protein [Hyphomicrobiaceae bacterium]